MFLHGTPQLSVVLPKGVEGMQLITRIQIWQGKQIPLSQL